MSMIPRAQMYTANPLRYSYLFLRGHLSIGLFLILLCLSPGCKSGEEKDLPSGVLSEETLVAVLTDVYLTEGVMIQLEYIQQKQPQSGQPYYKVIFEKHGVSREDFVQTLKIYAENQEMIDRVYDQVVQELSKKQMEVQQQKEKLKTDTL